MAKKGILKKLSKEETKTKMIFIPEQLKDLKFCRVGFRSKKPIEKEWTRKPYNYEEMQQFIINENYGVLCGEDLAVVDIDDEKFARQIEKELIPTFAVKTGGGGIHLYYFVDGLKKKIILEEKEKHIGEIQWNGQQVVGPESIHPNGKKYEILDSRPIAKLPYKRLLRVFAKFMKVSVDDVPKRELGQITKQIAKSINFEQLLSGYGLTQKGQNWNCPYHKSVGGQCLSVDSKLGIFHCFHCERGGNIIKFVSELEGITIQQALQKLKPKKKLKLPEKQVSKKVGMGVGSEEKLRSEVLSLLLDDKRPVAVESVVKSLYKNNHFYSIRDDKTQEIWIYREGIYLPHGKSYVEEFVRELLLENYTSQFSNQVIDRIRVDNFIDKEPFFSNQYPNEIVVENGILNVYTKELSPHTPDKIFLSKINVKYDPKAKCELIDKYFDDTIGEQKIQMYEFGGDCLQKTYINKKIIVQEGEKDTAKSTTQNLLIKFFGENNCSGLTIDKLTKDSFSLGELHNKLLNCCGEITSAFIGNIRLLKLLTGDDFINFKRKFLSDFKFRNYAKLIFACNELPIINADLSMWNRFIIFRYETQFVDKGEFNSLLEKERKNKKIKDKTILSRICSPEEFSGLLNKFLDGFERINKSNYSNTKTAEDNKLFWVRKSDSFRAFCLDNIEEDPLKCVENKELDKLYNKYCSDKKLKRLTKKHIRFVLETEYYANNRQISPSIYAWEGIKIKGNK